MTQSLELSMADDGDLGPAKKRILESGSPDSPIDESGTTWLMWAIWHDLEFVKWLIEHGASVNASRHDGTTVLMSACFTDLTQLEDDSAVEVVRILLQSGASQVAENSSGRKISDILALQQVRGPAFKSVVRLLKQAKQ